MAFLPITVPRNFMAPEFVPHCPQCRFSDRDFMRQDFDGAAVAFVPCVPVLSYQITEIVNCAAV